MKTIRAGLFVIRLTAGSSLFLLACRIMRPEPLRATLLGMMDGYLARARAVGHPAIQALDARRAGEEARRASEEATTPVQEPSRRPRGAGWLS